MLEGVCAFPPDGILAFTYPCNFLVLRNWKVTNKIIDPVPGNARKFWLKPLPNFDIEHCPFIISSGNATYNIVNVKSETMQILVQATVPNWFGA